MASVEGNARYWFIGGAVVLVVVLALVKGDIDERDAFLCKAVHENDMDMETCPAHNSNTSWLLVIAFGVAFVLLAIAAYPVFVPKDKPKKDLKLSKEEKVVVDLLQESGSLYQSDLVKQTEYSKVKLTRILDKLEHNGVVERKRRGMTNIVVLK